MGRTRVVIVGAGFGGLECAKALDGGPVDVLLVDRNNYHLFSPLLYQVASSLLNPSDIAYPVRRVFRSSANVRFRQAQITAIDLDARQLDTDDGEQIAYDYLVLAAGSTTNFFGNARIEEGALGLKTLGEALQLRNHVLTCLEEASQRRERNAQRPWMTFVIVGGGPTGVEYAGALAELMRLVLAKEYPAIEAEPRIVLVEGQDQPLAAFSAKLGSYARRRLESLGVEVCTGKLVSTVAEGEVELFDGTRIGCRTLVWSAGVKPAALAEVPGLGHTERSRRVAIDGFLRLEGYDDAFAIGDMAASAEGEELPMLSAPAMQQGRYAAAFILAHPNRAGGEPTMAPFAYQDKGTMATIGRHAAVCAVGSLELTGFIGWIGWLVVHIYYLIGFRNRLVVLWSWSWNYLWYDRPVRIITRAEGAPVALKGSALTRRGKRSD